jgi:hypothetical protein
MQYHIIMQVVAAHNYGCSETTMHIRNSKLNTTKECSRTRLVL